MGCGPTASGPFEIVFSGRGPVNGVLTDRADNDRPACYRLRPLVDVAAGDWSEGVCVTPRPDPFPPRVELTLLRASASEATIRIEAWEIPALGEEEELLDPETLVSGAAEMRISTRADFERAAWEPYEPKATIRLDGSGPQTIYVEVRDVAGNVSDPAELRVKD